MAQPAPSSARFRVKHAFSAALLALLIAHSNFLREWVCSVEGDRG